MPVEADVLRHQVDQVLSSNTFRSSGSLRRLLEYLIECALTGDTQDLKEYRIGVEALGKEPSYDPRIDPSVRVQVGRLRSRLAEYYVNEGRNDPILITVPKGAFSVVFEDRRPPPPLPVSEPLPPAEVAATPPGVRWPMVAIAATGLCVLVLAVLAFRPSAQSPSAVAESPAFQELWRPYLVSDKPVLVSLGVPLWLRVEATTPDGTSLSGHLRDARINQWPANPESEEAKRVQQWKKQLRTDSVEPSYQYLAVGEAVGAIVLGKSLGKHSDLTIVRSNMLSWDAVSGSNVIFIGAPKFNPHLRNVPLSRNFRIGDFYVYNPNPEPGEKKQYPDVDAVTDTRGAALIGRYRSPGGGSWFTLVGSANSMCTWAAIEYLTKPEYVAQLTASLREAFGKVPESFEVVIEARFDQSSPVDVRHVAIRELQY